MASENKPYMSRPLTPEIVQSFLDRHKDPADARRFLQDAGLIDENGELAKPYRPDYAGTNTP